jgi:hypothetical protein
MAAKEIKEKFRVVPMENLEMIYTLESLRVHKRDYCVEIELRHTKANLINVDGQVCKPSHIEVYKTGKCRLWYAYPRGKSFSSTCSAMEVKFIKKPLTA